MRGVFSALALLAAALLLGCLRLMPETRPQNLRRAVSSRAAADGGRYAYRAGGNPGGGI
jgi:predicted MFS family arabinose efflux permease